MYTMVKSVDRTTMQVKILKPVQVQLAFETRKIQPCYIVGNGVKVIGGLLTGQTGYIVAVDNHMLTISCPGNAVVPGVKGNPLLSDTPFWSSTQPTTQLDRSEVHPTYSLCTIID
jgi:hypothetical protein